MLKRRHAFRRASDLHAASDHGRGDHIRRTVQLEVLSDLGGRSHERTGEEHRARRHAHAHRRWPMPPKKDSESWKSRRRTSSSGSSVRRFVPTIADTSRPHAAHFAVQDHDAFHPFRPRIRRQASGSHTGVPGRRVARLAQATVLCLFRDAPAGSRTWIYRLGGGRLIHWTTRA